MAQARTHVTLTVTVSSPQGEASYRLVSPTGRALVLTRRALDGTLYDLSSFGGRGGRITLPLATVEALARLGILEAPSLAPTPALKEE